MKFQTTNHIVDNTVCNSPSTS